MPMLAANPFVFFFKPKPQRCIRLAESPYYRIRSLARGRNLNIINIKFLILWVRKQIQRIIDVLENVVAVDIITGAMQGTSVGSGDSAVRKTDVISHPESHTQLMEELGPEMNLWISN